MLPKDLRTPLRQRERPPGARAGVALNATRRHAVGELLLHHQVVHALDAALGHGPAASRRPRSRTRHRRRPRRSSPRRSSGARARRCAAAPVGGHISTPEGPLWPFRPTHPIRPHPPPGRARPRRHHRRPCGGHRLRHRCPRARAVRTRRPGPIPRFPAPVAGHEPAAAVRPPPWATPWRAGGGAGWPGQ